MFYRNRSLSAFAGIIILLVWVRCGQVTPLIPVPSASPSNPAPIAEKNDALKLGIQIGYKIEDHFHIETALSRLDPRGNQNEFALAQVLHLNRRPNFVWPEDSLDSPIQSAFLSHSVLDHQNRSFENLSPQPIRHDSLGRRWYFSVTELFQNGKYYPSHPVFGEDTQIVILELNLLNQRKSIIELKFRVKL